MALAPEQRQLAEVERQLSYNQLYRYKPYPKQMEFHAAGGKPGVRDRLLIAGNQLGKGEPVTEPVLTPTGWIEIGKLKVNDAIIAGDGSVTHVTGVFPRGVLPIVEVEFCYGAKVLVDPEHLWCVQTPQTRFKTTSISHPMRDGKRPSSSVSNRRHGEWEVLTTAAMRSKYGDNPLPKYRYAAPVVGACEFASGPVPVAPYVLGVLLGDGGLTHGVTITSADASVLAAVRAEVERFGGVLVHRSRYDHNAIRAAALKDTLRSLNVLDHGSATKRVPHQYLWNSAEVRLAVLQGLMDTDGTCEKSGNTSFTSTSKGLAEDVLFLARSFGGKGYMKSRLPTYTYRGEKKFGRRAYTVVIRLPHVPLFRLERKIKRYIRPTSTSDHNIIVGFRDAPPAEVVCISVAHPSRLYVTRDFIVTHNTLAASREGAMHSTGKYPDWWTGARFLRPTTGWAASLTSQGTRDTVQRLLMGPPGQWGTGAIPKKLIIDVKKATHGVADALETIMVRHEPTGGISRITLKTYDQGRERWQGDTLNWLWFDEEPPEDIYDEGLTRLVATGGLSFMTFTPLQGMSAVVRRFLMDKKVGTHVTQMTIEDALHFTAEERAAVIARYPEHQRAARAMGKPMLGSGLIFPYERSLVEEPAIQIPDFWPRLSGLDFGFDHPTAVVWGAWDRDSDTVHVYDCYRRKETLPVIHSAAIRARGVWIPCAWPHDGDSRDGRNSGETYAQQYRDLGVNMMRAKATHPPDPKQAQREGEGGVSLETGLTMMGDRIVTGRLKVGKHLADWWEEYDMYHRENGLVVKEMDDLMSATRVMLMMVRHAKVRHAPREPAVRGFVPMDAGMGALG